METTPIFLPFNKGNKNGAGNEPNGGIKTDYLWKEILTKDTLTNILQKLCQVNYRRKRIQRCKGQEENKENRKINFPTFSSIKCGF